MKKQTKKLECEKSPTGKHDYKCIFASGIRGRPLEKKDYLVGTFCLYCLKKQGK